METLLLQLGLGITSNAIYDFLKSLFLEKPEIEVAELKNKLSSFLNIQSADIKSEKIISFLCNNGNIRIVGTKIYAEDSISLSSSKTTSFILGDMSSSTTKNSRIDVGSDSYIQGQGGAGIRQNSDGSIDFFT